MITRLMLMHFSFSFTSAHLGADRQHCDRTVGSIAFKPPWTLMARTLCACFQIFLRMQKLHIKKDDIFRNFTYNNSKLSKIEDNIKKQSWKLAVAC